MQTTQTPKDHTRTNHRLWEASLLTGISESAIKRLLAQYPALGGKDLYDVSISHPFLIPHTSLATILQKSGKTMGVQEAAQANLTKIAKRRSRHARWQASWLRDLIRRNF